MASLRGTNDGVLLAAGVSLGAVALYLGLKLYKKVLLCELNSKLSCDDGIKRAEASARLRKAPLFSKLDALKQSFEGYIITPDDEDMYMEARNRAFNQDVRGFPLVIARPKHTQDVIKVVDFVRDHGAGIPFCIASGAHSNRCMMSGSFVLDLADMNTVHVDADALTVSAGGGAYLRNIDEALAPHGLATTLGTYPWTGVGGLVLAGGFGWLGRSYGFSVDNLLEVEVVLANGTAVVATDANEHAPLLWACRGGAGNFGVVTRFLFRAHRLPPHCLAGLRVFLAPTTPAAARVLRRFDSLLDDLPHATSAMAVLIAGAASVATLWCHIGDAAAARDVPALRRAAALGGWATLMDSVRPASYHFGAQTMTTPFNPSGRLYVSLVIVGDADKPLPDRLLADLLAYTRKRMPRALNRADVLLFTMGGRYRDRAAAGAGPAGACVSDAMRAARYLAIVEAGWAASAGDAGRDAAHDWARGAVVVLRPYQTADLMHAPDAVQEGPKVDGGDDTCHDLGYGGGGTWARLRALKAQYDPANLFRQNANIPPADHPSQRATAGPGD